jgi:hypothetical protein
VKKLMYGIAVLALAATVLPAQAKPPKFKATCPTDIEVKANKEGRVRINDKEATVKENSPAQWDATQGDVTVSVGVQGDKLEVLYTGKGGVNGVCKVTSYEAAGGPAKPAIPAADEKACLEAVSKETKNATVATLRTNTSEANNTVIVGVGADKAKWKCLVKEGKVAGVTSMTNEGAN